MLSMDTKGPEYIEVHFTWIFYGYTGEFIEDNWKELIEFWLLFTSYDVCVTPSVRKSP